MTGPRPGSEPRSGGRPITPGERRLTASERQRVTRVPQRPWLELHAVRIRWTTWIATALIVIRLISPRPEGWRRWSDAVAALDDVESARTAALMYYQAASRQWPSPGRFGVAPPGTLAYLPGGTSFSRERYRLAWEYAADTTSGARVIGLSVVGTDPLLAQAMAQRAPAGMPFIVSGGRFTALIASATGR